MDNRLKHVLERKGWIKEEPEMTDTNEYKVYTKCILPLDKGAAATTASSARKLSRRRLTS